MKFTLSWLKDYLDTTATLDEICEGLIGVGLEVEEVTDKTRLLAAFTVAYVSRPRSTPMPTSCGCARSRPTGRHQAGGLRRAQCAHRHQGDHRAARRHHSGDG